MARLLVVFALALAMTRPAMAMSVDEALSAESSHYENLLDTSPIDDKIPNYPEYIQGLDAGEYAEPIVIEAVGVSRYVESGVEKKPEILADYLGESGQSLLAGEDSLSLFEFEVKTPGLYTISARHCPVAGKNATISRAIFLDGALPYKELSLIEFSRVWTDGAIMGPNGKVWEQDNQGNDRRPSMQEAPEWMDEEFFDSNGYVTESLQLNLSKGKHVLALLSVKEPMLLKSLTLKKAQELPSYEEVARSYPASSGLPKESAIVIQGESASKTSSQMLYPSQDTSAPSISPSSAKVLKNNSIGGNSWRRVGQWIEWDFEISNSGVYNISAHVKQNFQRGAEAARIISIDGKVPFKEMGGYGFGYQSNWRLEELKSDGGTPYGFYLEAGHHTIRMEAALGKFAEITGTVQAAVYRLNEIYRKVIKVTGVSPDEFRDYQIASSLPGLKAELSEAKALLAEAVSELEGMAGDQRDQMRALNSMGQILDDLIQDQEKFTKILPSYKVELRACGTWLSSALNQPLQLDALFIYPQGEKVKLERQGFFSKVGYEIQKLYYSFIIDYNRLGNVIDDSQSITLWVGSGRDQGNVMKKLIDENFTPESGIGVNVMLVDMSTLLQATLSGQGPDAAVQVANDLPMNYGLRKAVANLSEFSDLGEVSTRFRSSAMVPFTFGNAVYALPETQTFPMMFYRKDILAEIGLSIPKTWSEMSQAMSSLAKSQLELGVLPSEMFFSSLLYQYGGAYYNEDASLSALDSDEAILAFKKYCELYTDYRLDPATSVDERFRTGETPIIINDYTFYNNLQVSAPDIKGMWGIAPIPGVESESGIDNTAASGAGGSGSTSTACVIMNASKKKEAAWEFLKWWTSAETQTLFGAEMESLMGVAARIPTANIEAFGSMPWPRRDFEALETQFANVKGIPQVPGGYFTYRNVNNAFYTVRTRAPQAGQDAATPREELMDRVRLVNDEIRYKRIEFGLAIS